jgi:tetratricopeptide (TPR) repeat protein
MFNFKKIIFALAVVGILALLTHAQKKYIGEPVTKNGLIKALKMRQFKTSDMVAIINEQGCEFRLDKDAQKELIRAGARPEVIEAVRRNFRGALKIKPTNSNTYEGLIGKAVNIYESERNAKEAQAILQQAIALEPNKYRAYQMLGYVTLYGRRDFKQAEQFMRKAIELGGSAVFRVKHSHDYNFLNSCSGSFYISQGNIRYEDDENFHTFQVRDSDIIKIETGNKWAGLLKLKGGIFNVVIRDKADVKDKDKYQFSPLTGKNDEAKMIVNLVGKG